PRIEVLGDAPDRAALPRRVPPLEDHDDPRAGRPYPVLHLHQLRLQPVKLLLVHALRQLAACARTSRHWRPSFPPRPACRCPGRGPCRDYPRTGAGLRLILPTLYIEPCERTASTPLRDGSPVPDRGGGQDRDEPAGADERLV